MVSLLSNIPGMGSNVSALRVIRVLRPLRTLSILPGMRVLIGTMIRSVPMIANVGPGRLFPLQLNLTACAYE